MAVVRVNDFLNDQISRCIKVHTYYISNACVCVCLQIPLTLYASADFLQGECMYVQPCSRNQQSYAQCFDHKEVGGKSYVNS